MLGWLALIAAALTGLFIFFQNHSGTLDMAYPGLTVVAAVAILAGACLFTLFLRPGSGSRLWLAVPALFLCVAGTAAWLTGKDAILATLNNKAMQSESEHDQQKSPGTVSVMIRRNADGIFLTHGQINGADASLLFDTGASIVMVKPTDAERAGIDVKNLTFNVPVQTANGTVYAAPVRIRSVAVGLLKVEDVEGLVASPGSLNENLLGMNFLRRLASYDLAGDFLTLRE